MQGFLKLNSYIHQCIDQRLFPGAVVLVGDERADLFFRAYGHAQVEPDLRPMVKDAVFDLASLTKPIATATSILILAEEQMLKTSDRLAHYLPFLRTSPYKDVTIWEALIHTSGIPAWFPLYLISSRPDEELEHIGYLAPRFNPGAGVEYSCLNYILLGALVESVSGFSLAQFARMKIFGPLGMADTGFLPPRSPQARFVTTEVGNNWERDACQSYDRRVEVAWRDYPISGEVHDGNSFYGFRGTGGNAGLFSTAADLAIFLRSLLNHKSVVGPATIERMIENHTAHLDQGRGLGWGVGSRFAGTKLSRKTFGHTGFTGCCTYADPVTRIFVMLLTNSVHPRVRKGILDEIRPQVCDLAYEGVAELLE